MFPALIRNVLILGRALKHELLVLAQDKFAAHYQQRYSSCRPPNLLWI